MKQGPASGTFTVRGIGSFTDFRTAGKRGKMSRPGVDDTSASRSKPSHKGITVNRILSLLTTTLLAPVAATAARTASLTAQAVVISLIIAGPAAFGAEPPSFHNQGVLSGFTGGNQRSKVTETAEQDVDGNGTSLKCRMLRREPDTPSGGCHAEAHLSRFPDSTLLGQFPGFAGTTVYQVRFDRNCEAASVGFFQYKNCAGPDQWKYLVAIWRASGKNGEEIQFQVNPQGASRHHYAALSVAHNTALVPDRWHQVRVTGLFTNDASGWAEVSINGRLVEWFRDRERTQPIGTRITGTFLPQLPGAQWQLQLGGYGFFKDRRTSQATVFVDDIKVWDRCTPLPASTPL